MRGVSAVVCVLALTATLAIGAAAADKRSGSGDEIWARSDADSLGIDRIAMLPAAAYNHDLAAEHLVEGALARALRPAGYRWISAATAKDLLLAQPAGDSLLKAVRQALLDQPRLDSLVAPVVCGRLRCDAVLTVRVERWEQIALEDYQSGKPFTTITLRAALVDSLGRLVWSAAGSETAEGSYQSASRDPRATPTGGSLNQNPLATGFGPPSYQETLTALLGRWTGRFPPHPAALGSAK